jgi:hypothetical protein
MQADPAIVPPVGTKKRGAVSAADARLAKPAVTSLR